LPAPESLQSLLRSRVAGLSPTARDVLVVAAALSLPTLAAIETVMGAPAAEAIREGEAAGVIEIEAARVRFTHPLLRSVVYSEVPISARASLHGRIPASAQDPEERSRHLAMAVDGQDEGAAATCEEGARVARSRGAPDSAAPLAVRALQL